MNLSAYHRGGTGTHQRQPVPARLQGGVRDGAVLVRGRSRLTTGVRDTVRQGEGLMLTTSLRAACAGLLMGLAAGIGSAAADSPKQGGKLIYGIESEIPWMDPHVVF